MTEDTRKSVPARPAATPATNHPVTDESKAQAEYRARRVQEEKLSREELAQRANPGLKSENLSIPNTPEPATPGQYEQRRGVTAGIASGQPSPGGQSEEDFARDQRTGSSSIDDHDKQGRPKLETREGLRINTDLLDEVTYRSLEQSLSVSMLGVSSDQKRLAQSLAQDPGAVDPAVADAERNAGAPAGARVAKPTMAPTRSFAAEDPKTTAKLANAEATRADLAHRPGRTVDPRRPLPTKTA